MDCPYCGVPVFKPNGARTKLKARTTMIVLHKSGSVEINCGSCGQGVLVPLELKADTAQLEKASHPRLIVPKA